MPGFFFLLFLLLAACSVFSLQHWQCKYKPQYSHLWNKVAEGQLMQKRERFSTQNVRKCQSVPRRWAHYPGCCCVLVRRNTDFHRWVPLYCVAEQEAHSKDFSLFFFLNKLHIYFIISIGFILITVASLIYLVSSVLEELCYDNLLLSKKQLHLERLGWSQIVWNQNTYLYILRDKNKKKYAICHYKPPIIKLNNPAEGSWPL